MITTSRECRIKYGYQQGNPGNPGKSAETRVLDGKDAKQDAAADLPGIAFEIPSEQNVQPGLRGTLRIEARPWALATQIAPGWP